MEQSITENQAMAQLSPRHMGELEASAISAPIIAANFRTVDGLEFEDLILRAELEDAAGNSQYATAPVRRILEKHAGARELGGWYCAGVDFADIIRTHQAWEKVTKSVGDDKWASIATRFDALPVSRWGCFKPDRPRRSNWRKNQDGQWEQYEGKIVKYEHPGKTPTSVFALVNPENPRFWIEILADASKFIVLVEGAKKAAALISAGIPAIALPGVAQWNKPGTRELLDELAIFAREGRKIYIAFDRDTKAKTVRNVNIEKSKLASALRRKKATVFIAEWSPALGKGPDDVIAAHGAKPIADAIANADQFEYWTLKHLSTLSYAVNYRVPVGQRFIDGAKNADGSLVEGEAQIPFPEFDKFLALVAPKGTGKTEAIARLVDVAIQNGQRVLFITHRVQLTQALCDRTGIPSIYQICKGEADQSKGYGLCVQSLHEDSQAGFDAAQWSDALIIFDEVEQVLWDVLDSSTCRNSRVKILRCLRQLVSNALSPGTDGRLLIADADLSDVSIDFLRGMAGDGAPRPWLVKSEYKGDAATYDVAVYTSNEQLLEKAEAAIADGQKIFCVSDSQRTKSRFSSSALEARWANKYPSLKILRIDSSTLARRDHPAFGCISNLNAVIKGMNYDIVIASPSVETGVSIDLRAHFDRVVGFYQGVMSENSVRQSLARIRDNIPRDITLPARGLSFAAAGELSAANIEAATDRQTKTALSLIFDAARADDIESNFLPSATHAWARFSARQNAGMSAYHDVIAAGLAAEGHRVTLCDRPEAGTDEAEQLSQMGKILTSDRHDRLKAEADAIVEANDLTDSQVAKLEKSASVKSEAEQLALKKALAARMYPGHPMTPDLLILHEYGWHPKIKLHYALTMGNQFVKEGDRAKIDELIDGRAVWGADIKRSTLSLKVGILQLLKVDQLIELDEISNETPEVIELAEKAGKNRIQIKGILGFSISDAEVEKPVSVAKKFLTLLGFTTGKARKTTRNGKTIRYYPVEICDYKNMSGFDADGEFIKDLYTYETSRLFIFEAWLERDLKKATGENSEAAIADIVPTTAPITAAKKDENPTAETTKKGQPRYRSIIYKLGCPDLEVALTPPTAEATPKILPITAADAGGEISPVIETAKILSPPTARPAILNAVSNPSQHHDPTFSVVKVERSTDPLSDSFYRPWS